MLEMLPIPNLQRSGTEKSEIDKLETGRFPERKSE
jgi:hypothetical protein